MVKYFSNVSVVYVTDRSVSTELADAPIEVDIQVIPIALYLRKEKWHLIPAYQPPCQNQKYFIESVEIILDFHIKFSEKLQILGNLSMEKNTYPREGTE